MNVEVIALMLFGGFALLSRIVGPVLGSRVEKVKSVRDDVERLALKSTVDWGSRIMLWGALSLLGVFLVQLYIYQMGGATIEEIIAARDQLAVIGVLVQTAGTYVGVLLMVLLGSLIVLIGISFYTVYRRGGAALSKIANQNVARWEDLPLMIKIATAKKELEQIYVILKNSQPNPNEESPETKLDPGDRAVLEINANRLLEQISELDLERRRRFWVDPATLGASTDKGAKRSLLHRIGLVFISEGMMSTLSMAGRVASIALVILLLLSMLSVATVPLQNDIKNKQSALDRTLDRLEFKIALNQTDKEFEDALRSLAQATKAKDTTPEIEDLSDTVERTARILAYIFEAQVFPDSVAGRRSPDQDRDQYPYADLTLHRAWVRDQILNVAGQQAAGGTKIRVESAFRTKTPEGEALRLITSGPIDGPPRTFIGHEALTFFRQLIKNHPGFLTQAQAMVEDYIRSFGRVVSLEHASNLLLSQALGHMINWSEQEGSLQKFARGLAALFTGDILGRLKEAGLNIFATQIITKDGLQQAVDSSFERRISTQEEVDTARLMQAIEELPNMDRITASMRTMPASANRSPEASVDFQSAAKIAKKHADNVKLRGSKPIDALSTFPDFFPGYLGADQETPRARAGRRVNGSNSQPGKQSEINEARFSRSRSYTQLRGFSQVGGVLLGRPPEDEAVWPINDLQWSDDENPVTLTLYPEHGPPLVLGPYRGSLVHHALLYAADGRPVAVTIIPAKPLFDLRILLHPTLVDTLLGYRTIRLDKFVDERSSKDEDLNKLREKEAEKAHKSLSLYTVAWTARMKTSGENIQQFAESRDYTKARTRLSKSERLKPIDLEPLRERPAYFNAQLVIDMDRCLASNGQTLDQFLTCIKSNTTTPISRVPVDGHEQGPAPPPLAVDLSGVREQAYSWSDPSSVLFRPEDDPLWPLRFMVHMALGEPLVSAPNGRQWPDNQQTSVEDTPVWELLNVNPSIDKSIRSLVLKNADGEHAVILRDLTEFAILQRLFRSALDGFLGETFPIEKLVALADDTLDMADSAHRTPRWLTKNCSIELRAYLDWLQSISNRRVNGIDEVDKEIMMLNKLRDELGVIIDDSKEGTVDCSQIRQNAVSLAADYRAIAEAAYDLCVSVLPEQRQRCKTILQSVPSLKLQ